MSEMKKLNKELGLFDVFTISTGAMFSSGFFLLPGLASQYTGPSVFVAYLIAGILIMPAMFSMAEIATALPRSGGAYFFLDRSLGPLFGTIGGLGTYFALMFKTAFAIIGIGAYASFFWDVPVRTIAVMAVLFFTILNLIGAKKTSGMQNFLVVFLLLVVGTFIIDGIVSIYLTDIIEPAPTKEHFTPFFSEGFEGVITTVGFVFVSYLGLTQIASVAEEIKNPERNIPLGMLISLIVTGLVYFLGVFVMVSLINPEDFARDLAPAATATSQLFRWLPNNSGAYIMTAAAMAAFASTGNAGLLSSSRYPFAMSRDKLFPGGFSKVSKLGTPIPAILLTASLILFFILVLSEEGIAKLASTFQLFIFMLINFSVIVFRKSKIESYDPGYHSPLYPAMQIAGIIISFILIIYMGWMAIIFSTLIILVAVLWYKYYVRIRVQREGAIFHWFALLGKYQHPELENEFMTILKEKGLRHGDPFDETIIRSRITHIHKTTSFEKLVEDVSDTFATEMHIRKHELIREFMATSPIEPALIIPEVSLLYAKHDGIDHPSLNIIITEQGIRKPVSKGGVSSEDYIKVFFFLVNPAKEARQQLRMLSRLVDIIERKDFVKEMMKHDGHRSIKEYLLHNERFITVKLIKGTEQQEMIGKQLKELNLPSNVLVALVERNNETFAPTGNTVLQEKDVITIIGKPKSISQLYEKYKWEIHG
ncbi:amino acid permease [Alkalitalea saponilacus]|uniref:Amino acid transporter n=1 Tax=Alkalitalea saponilacus TaxID=889453 RepID=A0A1T5H5D9_9BACT|nr:amino acid permease [Alkalitalea saponilacus]ASB50873.1 amino acid transporter [Alkalitalea saponilacus]SKC15876.1 Amino acid transporter [Alkalitalea saponilacus]